MGDYPILTAIIVTPLIGALLLLLTPARRPEIARAVGILASVATLGFALLLLWKFQTGYGGFQFLESNRWFDSLGVGYIVGVDGFSLFMVVVTAALFPIGLLASARGIEHRVKAYMFWFLLLETAIMGIFLSLDLVAFFVFWEAMLVPMYFLIAGWGSANRRYAAMKFFIYTAAGSAFLLAALLVLAFLHQADTGVAHLRLPGARRVGWPVRVDRALAVPRVHGRVRDQGAAGPVPHVAPRRAHRGADRRLGRAGRRDPEDGRLRRPALRRSSSSRARPSTSRRCSSRSR